MSSSSTCSDPSKLVTGSANTPGVVMTNYTSDMSTGAQNYFDSEVHNHNGGTKDFYAEDTDHEVINRSGAFGSSLVIPKSYKMPSVPKKISRLHTNYIPMPNTKESESRVMQPISIKELIQDNFGFNTTDDETDGECMSENDLSISSSTDSIPAPSLSQSNSGTEVKTSSNFLLICDDLSHEFPNTPVHQLEKGFNEGVEELKGLNSPEKVKDECVLVSEGEEKCASVPGCAFSSPDILSDIQSPAARAELSTRGEKTNDICDSLDRSS